jgi:anti-sigma B factor antagonist
LAITITTRKIGDITVAHVVGRITLGAGSSTLRDTIQELSVGEHPRIVLNLSGVSSLDSSGIGELVSGFTITRSRGGALKLLALPKRVEELLRMTGVSRIFEIHDDEAHALRSFE